VIATAAVTHQRKRLNAPKRHPRSFVGQDDAKEGVAATTIAAPMLIIKTRLQDIRDPPRHFFLFVSPININPAAKRKCLAAQQHAQNLILELSALRWIT